MTIFERFVTHGLKKRIAVFKRQNDGSYTHETYTSLISMPEEERLEFLSQCGCDKAVQAVLQARRNKVKCVTTQNEIER
jgi:hypothetical protein